MNASCRLIARFLMIFVMCSTAVARLSLAGESPLAPSLRKQAASLDEQWKAGKQSTYFVEADLWTRQLRKSPRDKDTFKIAVETLGYLLDKEFTIRDMARDMLDESIPDPEKNRITPEISDLMALRNLASCLASWDDVSVSDRSVVAGLLASCLGKVRAGILVDYADKPVSLNVCPPPDTGGPAAAGMDPDDIVDPVARAKYKAAIQANLENGISNARQQELRGLSEELSTILVPYLAETFRGKPRPSQLLDECIKTGRLRASESITVALSPFAPRKLRSFAERKATLVSAPILSDKEKERVMQEMGARAGDTGSRK